MIMKSYNMSIYLIILFSLVFTTLAYKENNKPIIISSSRYDYMSNLMLYNVSKREMFYDDAYVYQLNKYLEPMIWNDKIKHMNDSYNVVPPIDLKTFKDIFNSSDKSERYIETFEEDIVSFGDITSSYSTELYYHQTYLYNRTDIIIPGSGFIQLTNEIYDEIQHIDSFAYYKFIKKKSIACQIDINTITYCTCSNISDKNIVQCLPETKKLCSSFPNGYCADGFISNGAECANPDSENINNNVCFSNYINSYSVCNIYELVLEGISHQISFTSKDNKGNILFETNLSIPNGVTHSLGDLTVTLNSINDDSLTKKYLIVEKEKSLYIDNRNRYSASAYRENGVYLTNQYPGWIEIKHNSILDYDIQQLAISRQPVDFICESNNTAKNSVPRYHFTQPDLDCEPLMFYLSSLGTGNVYYQNQPISYNIRLNKHKVENIVLDISAKYYNQQIYKKHIGVGDFSINTSRDILNNPYLNFKTCTPESYGTSKCYIRQNNVNVLGPITIQMNYKQNSTNCNYWSININTLPKNQLYDACMLNSIKGLVCIDFYFFDNDTISIIPKFAYTAYFPAASPIIPDRNSSRHSDSTNQTNTKFWLLVLGLPGGLIFLLALTYLVFLLKNKYNTYRYNKLKKYTQMDIELDNNINELVKSPSE